MPPPDVATPRCDWRVIGGITLFALAIRLAAAAALNWRNTDTDAYFSMADAILSGRPYSFFPNGYPLVIASLKLALGETLLVPALAGLNIALSTATVPLAAWLAATCFSSRAAVVAALLVAVWPNQINYTRQLLTEPAAAFFTVWAVHHLLRRRAFAAGLSAYAAALLRSTLLPAAVLFAGWAWYAHGRRAAAAYLLGAALLAGGEWALTATNVIAAPGNIGGNLLLATQAAGTHGRDFSLQTFNTESRANPLRAYLQFAAAQPAEFARLRMHSLWDLWGPWPDRGSPPHTRSMLARAAIGIRFVAFAAALAAVVAAAHRPEVWLLATVPVTITAIHVALFSLPRFTFTAEPFVLVLASGLIAGGHGLLRRHV